MLVNGAGRAVHLAWAAVLGLFGAVRVFDLARYRYARLLAELDPVADLRGSAVVISDGGGPLRAEAVALAVAGTREREEATVLLTPLQMNRPSDVSRPPQWLDVGATLGGLNVGRPPVDRLQVQLARVALGVNWHAAARDLGDGYAGDWVGSFASFREALRACPDSLWLCDADDREAFVSQGGQFLAGCGGRGGQCPRPWMGLAVAARRMDVGFAGGGYRS